MIKQEYLKLYDEFEKIKDLCSFCEEYSEEQMAIRFLLIRSFERRDICHFLGTDIEGDIRDLGGVLFQSAYTIQEFIIYIKQKKNKLISEREESVKAIPGIIENMGLDSCGVRNDSVDSLIQSFVRDRSIPSFGSFTERLDNIWIPKVRQYIKWSYYNQGTNDIIENYLLKQTNVIPTLRKIHHVDFFLEVGEQVLPFDLKITHVSDIFYDMYWAGIARNADSEADSYVYSNGSEEEIRVIKKIYSRNKRRLGLPNYSIISSREGKQPSKADIIEKLLSTDDDAIRQDLNGIMNKRKEMIEQLREDTLVLEWWNYKYQGERLFSNNNRMFLFFTYLDSYKDGRLLKGNLEEVKTEISRLFEGNIEDSIHKVKYHYDSVPNVGNYTAKCISSLITG